MMKEPICLTPMQIDSMTLRQLSLYYEEDQEVSYDDVLRHVKAWREKQAQGAT
jgi:hypothetical protein